MTPIAALYVNVKHGPYAKIPGVDCWGVERDATRYKGPHPVVAHPPCGHWGSYWHKCKDDGHTGPIAIDQVRKYGGVLEHPRLSRLWHRYGLPFPGQEPDAYGGRTFEVRQIDFGHRAEKPTWLYVVGLDALPPMPPSQPKPPKPPLLRTGRQVRGWCEMLSKVQRTLTPPAFAEWLVNLASQCKTPYIEPNDCP